MKSTSVAAVPNKHQLKTEATLRSLLDASERVFVRDGYERAQIETIAAEAGRTKGAVYAHYRSKEDIFFALIERKASSRRDEFLQAAEGKNLQQRLAIVKNLFLSALENENWPILMLEFKLLALRNKASLHRVQELYQLLYEDVSRAALLGRGISTDKTRERDIIALTVLRGIPSALLLEQQFNPALLSSVVTKQVFGAIFDALLVSETPVQQLKPPSVTRKPKRSKVQ